MPKKILQDEPIIISNNLLEIKKLYSRDQKVSCICAKCKSTFNRALRFINENLPTLCRKCQTEATAIQRYGSLAEMQRINLEHGKQTNLIKHGVSHYTNREKCKETKKEKYGNEFFTNREKCFSTIRDKYNVNNPSQIPGIQNKVRATKEQRYGIATYNNIEKAKETFKNKYGVENPGLLKYLYIYDDIHFDSSWELYYYIYNKDIGNDIKKSTKTFEYEYNNKKHLYHPDFEVNGKLVEIKGDQFFNNDGTMCCPFDHSLDGLYEAKHQCGIKNNVNFLVEKDLNIAIKYVNDKYTKNYVNLFSSNLEFPYLNQDLQDQSDMGLIHHFHKSIYDATRKGKVSPIAAWQDKNIIKKVALNRLKYKGSCKPSDILQGFNVTKIAAKVSVFKPKLAEELIKKYLFDADMIIDPFSGFSGRMLGAFNCGKHYIGWDINEDHVRESNEIAQYKKIEDMCDVKVQDLITFEGKDWSVLRDVCLFTCPPYGGKEHWNENNDEIEKSCDEWIDLCLEKHKGCKKYLFVVDKTKKYKSKIIDSISNFSHFGSNNEYIVLI